MTALSAPAAQAATSKSGAELRALRKQTILTGRQMAARLDVSPEHVSRVENERAPLTKTLELAWLHACKAAS